jgi:hypothetical protein
MSVGSSPLEQNEQEMWKDYTKAKEQYDATKMLDPERATKLYAPYYADACIELAKRCILLSCNATTTERIAEKLFKKFAESVKDITSPDLFKFCLKGRDLQHVLLTTRADCPLDDHVRMAQVAAALCSNAEMLKLDPARSCDAAYFGALAELRLGFASSAKKRVAEWPGCEKSKLLHDRLAEYLHYMFKSDRTGNCPPPQLIKKKYSGKNEITLTAPVWALFGLDEKKFQTLCSQSHIDPLTFKHVADALTRSPRQSGSDPAVQELSKEKVLELCSGHEDKLLDCCVLLMGMPPTFASPELVLEESERQLHWQERIRIGSWNIMCSAGYHSPKKSFKHKMTSVFNLMKSEMWNIVALQELPCSIEGESEPKSEGKSESECEEESESECEEKSKLASKEKKDIKDVIKQLKLKPYRWQWEGLRVGGEKKAEEPQKNQKFETGGFLFDGSYWKMKVSPKTPEKVAPEKFKRPPILALFESLKEPRVILAIASVHLKSKEVNLEETRDEVCQLPDVASELVEMAENSAQEDPRPRITVCAIIGDFNLSVDPRDPDTDPTLPDGTSAFDSLEKDSGFKPMLIRTPTNAWEVMSGGKAHCYDNCFAKVLPPNEAKLRASVANYPSHLPSLDDWTRTIDAAVASVPQSNFKDELKELVRTGLEQKRKNYMFLHTSDHRAITFEIALPGSDAVKAQEGEPEALVDGAAKAEDVHARDAGFTTPIKVKGSASPSQKDTTKRLTAAAGGGRPGQTDSTLP